MGALPMNDWSMRHGPTLPSTPEARGLMQDLAAAGPPTMIFLDARTEAPDSRLIGQMDSTALLASIAKVAP